MHIRNNLIAIFFILFLLPGYLTVLEGKAADLPSSGEELIITAHSQNKQPVPYILNYKNLSPKFVIILFPGRSGEAIVDGKLDIYFKGTFLLKSREYIVDEEFAAITTNSSSDKERIQGILDDIKRRFPEARVYLMGHSRGTLHTMSLAEYLSDKIEGEIHTASRSEISFFNAKKFKNRHLLVHHKLDQCVGTSFTSAEGSHKDYGNEFIAMSGGKATGDDFCRPGSYHQFNMIEKETIAVIKNWIKRGS